MPDGGRYTVWLTRRAANGSYTQHASEDISQFGCFQGACAPEGKRGMGTDMRADPRPGANQGAGQGITQGINRGVMIIGIVGVVLTLGNVFASVIFAALACFDTCPPVLLMVSSAPLDLLIMPLLVGPALALIGVGWIWELIALRRIGRQGALVVVALAPLITLVAVLAVAAIAAVSSGLAPQDFTPMHLWTGGFALALWPLLVSVVAFIWRERRSAPSS